MGAILNNTAYNLTSPITVGEVDMYDRLKISALMKRHQEIGELHLNVFGTVSEDMRQKQGMAFIFTKVAIKIHRLPILSEKVALTTWCSELKGVRFIRIYMLRDESGQLLTETKAEVVTIDLSTRKIVRPKDVECFSKFLYNGVLQNGCEYPQKIADFNSADEIFNRTVVIEDIDFNGHVNNTVYADMIFECLDADTLKKTPTEVSINFINEATLGEILHLGVKKTEAGILVKGNTDDLIKFTAEIKY